MLHQPCVLDSDDIHMSQSLLPAALVENGASKVFVLPEKGKDIAQEIFWGEVEKTFFEWCTLFAPMLEKSDEDEYL